MLKNIKEEEIKFYHNSLPNAFFYPTVTLMANILSPIKAMN